VVAGAQRAAFRVLGPLEVEAGGRLLEVGGPRLRALLALLVADAGRVVSVPGLVEGLWGQDAPSDAGRTARAYVSLLRKALQPVAADQPGRELIVTRRPGYVLRLDPDAVDAVRFERLAAAGRQALAAGQPAVAAGELAAALELWRGDAYGEFVDTPALRTEAARLEQLRLAVVADRIEADLAAGKGPQLIAELDALTSRHPAHERLWGHLMTALYQAGQQADALAAYRRARAALVQESGVEPTPVLAGIHQQILAHDSRLLAPASAGPGGGVGTARPAQLLPAAPAFTGREAELATLNAVLAAAVAQPTAAAVAAISGTAGVGKTALAVRWAHLVADRFPDGQLYVNLRGFAPGGQAMTPAEAIRGFLDALGVPAERIPPGLDAQAGLYRSLLADRRILVVLDNARDAEQARPLLPGTGTAMAVVTSRNSVTGLIVDGAHPITLDLLSTVEAHELLARRLGAGRVAAEPQAVGQIIGACTRLPLALAVVAARALQSTFSLAALAAELTDAGRRLDILDAGDPATRVGSVFSWSYTALTPPAARLFRLLGLHPGPDVSAVAAASLAGLPPPDTRRLLTELTRASLTAEHTPGRYSLHDLLRAYATDLAHTRDTPAGRRAATTRLLDHYTHTAHAAARLLTPGRDAVGVALTQPAPGATAEQLDSHGPAMAWLDAERPALLAAVRLAADDGSDRLAWQLAWALDTFLDRRGHWSDWAGAWQAALPAAGRLADPSAHAYAHRGLARVLTRLGQHDDAHGHYEQALDLYGRAGDRAGQAQTHHSLGILWGRQGRPEQAISHAQQALALFQAAGHHLGQANALNSVGWYHAELGDHTQALAYCQQALTLHQQADDRYGQAHTWDSLGYAHHHLAQFTQAADCYQHAIALYRDYGDRHEEAASLTRLGDSHQAAGDPDAARTTWLDAAAILTDLDHPDADTVRAKLRNLDQQPAPA
jgi:DNA-binding SARP family transcriptional activator/tetratricopeptide (TPR) repeat protein